MTDTTSRPFLAWPGWRQLGFAWLLTAIVTTWFAIVFAATNSFTASRALRVRVHSDAELRIPLIPAFLVFYMSIYLLILAAPFVLRTRREITRLAIAQAVAIFIAGILFLLIPAQLAYAPPTELGIWQDLFQFADKLNLDYNLVPSLHVALSLVCIELFAAHASVTGKLLLRVWGISIAISTILTHQHHVLDAVTGWLLALAVVKLTCRIEKLFAAIGIINAAQQLFRLKRSRGRHKPVTDQTPMVKRKLKIALISPKGPLYRHRGGIWKKSLRYQPLTLTTLAALVPPELDADLELFDEGIADVPLDLDADLVGLTVITGTAMRAYQLADHFRTRGITTVLGGPHVTLIPEDAQLHANAVVVGYAEDSWPQLLRDFALKQLQPRYDQAPELDLANRPFARRELLPSNRYLTNNVFEATRGCIHNCDFCVVPTAWGRQPYQKPVTDVIADIRQHVARKLIFVDLNIIADRDYAVKLFTALIPLRVQWYGLATVLLADDDELLDLAQRSGCKGLLMGLESISPQNLRQNHKGFNSPDKFARVVERLHDHGIALQGCFVFGLDHDEPDVFLKTAEFAVQAKIDLPRFAIATPFPNTALYQRLAAESRILTRNWELYDGQHVVFRPAKLSVEELQTGTEAAWKYAYSFRSIVHRITHSPASWPVKLGTNLGYRFYAHNLSRFYNCDWILPRSSRREEAHSRNVKGQGLLTSAATTNL